MLRDQIITALQTVIIFLLATNAISALAAMYAMRMASRVAQVSRQATAAERKVESWLRGIR